MCCCHFPVWAGALIIGLLEIIGALANREMGDIWAGNYMFFNSIWFALLFIPSLFYNGHYRKAVTMVYAISSIIMVIVALVLTILVVIYGRMISQALKAMMASNVELTNIGGMGTEKSLAAMMQDIEKEELTWWESIP
jgi:hypothetical protein